MSSSSPTPIRLEPHDAARYARLRLRMLEDAPWAFSASSDESVTLDIPYLAKIFDEEQSATFAIETPDRPGWDAGQDEPELVASASITRAKQRKFAHHARIWGVFVAPAHRGKGLGRALMIAAIDLSRTWPGVDFIDLGVGENSPEAQRLYESLGFEQWGREPEATEHEGQRYDEIYMTLRL